MILPKAARMKDSLYEKWRLFGLHGIPLWTTLLLMFLCLIPSDLVGISRFCPTVGLICVYYWSLKRGYIFGYISAFTVGFFMDVLSSSPLGINILLMMLTVFAVQWPARYFQSASFSINWFIFAVVASGVFVLKWLLLSVYYKLLISPNEIMFNYLATVLFYPLVAAINTGIQKLLPQERINE